MDSNKGLSGLIIEQGNCTSGINSLVGRSLSGGMMLKVHIAEDHDACRLALKLTLLMSKQYEIVGESHSGHNLTQELLLSEPDIAIVDLSLPGKDGFQVFKELKKMGSTIKFVIWSARSDLETVSCAVRTGVNGYLCKDASAEVMKKALAAVMQGDQWIDPEVALPMPAIRAYETQQESVA